jgi:short-subunit dehydrogenase
VLVLVARREERLRALADSLAPALGSERVSFVAADLVDADAPARIRAHVSERHNRLDLLVNNAGAAWRKPFAEGGHANVRRTMAINFDAQVRLTEALLPLLRASAPSAIVNVASTAARVTRRGTGAYSASKAALASWSDALWMEEQANGVHVGLVLPGFISTEGFPQSELTSKPLTRWLVSTPEQGARAIRDAGLGRRAERYVPRAYGLASAARILAPGLLRRAMGGSRAAAMTTTTGADLIERSDSHPGSGERSGGHPGSDERSGAHPGSGEQSDSHPGPDERSGGQAGPIEQSNSHPGPGERSGAHPGSDERSGSHPGPGEREASSAKSVERGPSGVDPPGQAGTGD